ncbi:hypothetical protein SELMODRAFT_416273 [Selaginella moellendorffii]|uniref:Uncharacterized protein n=1 Tax=Selaginella moellendorffii TaxID=88036 RepID=D8RYS0_SELML|nr:hypothetical protein SELMODRAFT_416273 [Selaginella moellendorffii]
MISVASVARLELRAGVGVAQASAAGLQLRAVGEGVKLAIIRNSLCSKDGSCQEKNVWISEGSLCWVKVDDGMLGEFVLGSPADLFYVVIMKETDLSPNKMPPPSDACDLAGGCQIHEGALLHKIPDEIEKVAGAAYEDEMCFISFGDIAAMEADKVVKLRSSAGVTLAVSSECLLQYLQLEFERGVGLLEVEIHKVGRLTKGMWLASLVRSNADADGFSRLYFVWTAANRAHLESKRELEANQELYMKVLAFIKDLELYSRNKGSEERINSHPPTAAAFFLESRTLNAMVSTKGVPMQAALEQKFRSSPDLLGICLHSTVVPELRRLFSIPREVTESKMAKDFHVKLSKSMPWRRQAI